MCDPMSIAGIVMSVGSTVANSMAAAQQQRARDDAMAAERIRQGKLDTENDALNAQSRDRFSDFGDQQEERRSQLADYFTQNEDAEQAAAAEQSAVANMLPTSGSDVTIREQQKQSNLAKAFTDQQGQALGQLRAFGDVLGGIGRHQARDAGLIGQVNAFKRGSSGVLPLELEAANEKGQGLRMFGDLLNMGGGMAMNSGFGRLQPGPNYFPPPPGGTVRLGGLW